MSPLFVDRIDAAQKLARALHGYAGKRPLVLALPRGAVPMGVIIADELEGELDVVLVRKIGAPGNPELAIGAVNESGWTYLSPYVAQTAIDSSYFDRERQAQLEVLKRRRARYTPGRNSHSAAGRIAIVVDDGLATGATMIAALQAVRDQHPSKLICAIPVGSPRTVAALSNSADEIVCLASPSNFGSVGEWYEHFPQVSDDEVVRCLTGNRGR